MTDSQTHSPYEDGENYALRDQSTTGLDFYLTLATKIREPILEIGCGTGRICIPLAAQGFDITGLEMSKPMLQQAKKTAAAHQIPINWTEADGCDFHLNQTFGLVYLTGNTFQAFLTTAQQQQMLACVHAHLMPEGTLAFETRNPRWRTSQTPVKSPSSWSGPEGLFAFLENTQAPMEFGTYTDAEGRNIRLSKTQRYDPVTQLLHWRTTKHWIENQVPQTAVEQVTVRYTFPRELDLLLQNAGFSIVEQYGNWDLSPLQGDSPSIITVAKKS